MNKAFVLYEKLSESTTTQVYRGYDPILQRLVLIKILQKHLVGNEQVRKRFEREAQALAAIRSEYIVQVYELTSIDNAPAIVMEYVEGESLADFIVKQKSLSAEQVYNIAVDILRGLMIVHTHGIIHRDIKPANILLSKTGIAKLTDFGLATVIHLPTLTHEGTLLGTPAYMSPEQVRGEQLDCRSDLFSLGLTLLEARTGRRFCEGATYAECIKNVLSFSFASIDQQELKLMQDEYTFYAKLLAQDKKERFSSAEEALKHLGVHDVSRSQKSPLLVKRVSIVLAFLLIGISVVVVYYGRKEREEIALQQRGQRGGVPPDTKFTLQHFPAHEAPTKLMSSRSINKQIQIDRRDTAGSLFIRSQEKDSVAIYILCKPWGKVFLNNEYIGETPFSSPVYLTPGVYVITFHHPHFVPIVRHYTVSANGKQSTIEANFLETAGYIVVNVKPWARIYIDDQYRETTPIAYPLVVTAGKRIVRFENPSYKPIVREVYVPIHDTITVLVDFRSGLTSE